VIKCLSRKSKLNVQDSDHLTDTDMVIYIAIISLNFKKYNIPFKILVEFDLSQKLNSAKSIGIAYQGIVEGILDYKSGFLQTIMAAYDWNHEEAPTAELNSLEKTMEFLAAYYESRNKISGTLALLMDSSRLEVELDVHSKLLKPWTQLRSILNYTQFLQLARKAQ
jgi:hypothetical protein